MKCKVCGGTGTSNTCVNGTFKLCSFCDGTGEYEPFDADIELDKLYPTEMDNEEWFCSLSTEEKADKRRYTMIICDKCVHKMYCIDYGTKTDKCKYCEPMTNEEWLKSLDTEGLVDYLYEVHKGGSSVERQRWIEEHKERIKMQFRGWLKEIHHAN